MGKYAKTTKKSDKNKGLHPVWTGIGCLLMVLIPILSYAAGSITVDLLLDRGLVPAELLITPQVPRWMWVLPALAGFIQGIFGQPNFIAVMLATVVYIIVLSGILTFGYAFIYRFIGPSRYGPMDAPPPKGVKPKKYTR